VNKSAVRQGILDQLRNELAVQTRAAQVSREEATSEESRAENKYDMHSQEAAYLAEGQARLAAEIAENILLYETLNISPVPKDGLVALGAAVAVEQGNDCTWFFMGPRAGGIQVEVDGITIFVLTPQSPVGRELMGKRVGDTVRALKRGSTAPQRIVELV
jgi:transcription elongation GreA/GreB family factor